MSQHSIGESASQWQMREKYWIPGPRKLTKSVTRNCSGSKRFQAVAFTNPPPAPLPRKRMEGNTPFNVTGVDFLGPVKCRNKRKEERKAYVVLYSCSLTRKVFLELLTSLETGEFLKSLKHFIARRGRPSRIYSDNGQTFVAAAKWLKKAHSDKELQAFLNNHSMPCHVPWWGDQFECLIGFMKAAFYKTVGQGLISWGELSEVIPDIKLTMNNRLLCYLEGDAQFPP